jgi:DNA polymerase (family 10)
VVENAEVARLFRELADLLEIEEANPFRVRAYRTAARTVENHPEAIADLAIHHPERLTDLPGIGEDLAGKIVDIARSGELPALEAARRRLPIGLTSLLRLPGLGPRRVHTLFRELGVQNAAALRSACRAQRVRELPGFGARLEERLLHELREHRDEERRFPRPVAAQYAEALLAYMRAGKDVKQAEWAGSFRRCKDTVGDLDLLITARQAEPVTQRFLAYPEAEQVLAHGTTRAAIRLRSGLHVDLRVLESASYGAGLYYFTGSKAHNIAVRRLAQARGLKLNEYGVWRGDTRIAGRTEREVARAVGIPLIPPELREDRGEIAAALAGTLPRLVEPGDIRGDLQSHTTASDGRDSLATMARAARDLGYGYLAITDHSPHLKVTHGLDREALRQQRAEIEKLNGTAGDFTLLAGVEVDILPDGSGRSTSWSPPCTPRSAWGGRNRPRGCSGRSLTPPSTSWPIRRADCWDGGAARRSISTTSPGRLRIGESCWRSTLNPIAWTSMISPSRRRFAMAPASSSRPTPMTGMSWGSCAGGWTRLDAAGRWRLTSRIHGRWRNCGGGSTRRAPPGGPELPPRPAAGSRSAGPRPNRPHDDGGAPPPARDDPGKPGPVAAGWFPECQRGGRQTRPHRLAASQGSP